MAEPVAVLVAARNEAERIGSTVARLREQFPDAEVIVADDGSTDGTAEAAERAGARVLRLPARGKGQALTLAEREAPPGPILVCDADLDGDLRPLASAEGGLAIAVFAERQGGGFGIAKLAARALIRNRSGFVPVEPLSGQRVFSAEAREVCFPLAAGFGCEVGASIDAARAGIPIAEVELPLRHRATGRDAPGFLHRGRQLLDAVLATGPQATNHRGLRLPLVGAALGARRDPAVALVAALGLADDLWSGPERGFRAHLRAGATTGVLKLVGIPLVGLLATRKLSGRAPRRPRRERAQPTRHAAGPRAQGVPRRRRPRPGAGRDRRPPASLRSSREDDARRRRIERAGRDARVEFRESTHGTGPLAGDRGACRAHAPR